MIFIATEGPYLTATVQIEDVQYHVMDSFSEGLDLKPGDSMPFELTADLLNEDCSWDSYFSSNKQQVRGLKQLSGWKYQAYGKIKSINPVVVDCDVLLVESPFSSNDSSIVGEYVGFVIERLGAYKTID